MGVVRISIEGSFNKGRGHHAFSAMKHGHARCLTDAIAFLVALLPDATRQDHDLHDEGERPEEPFGR